MQTLHVTMKVVFAGMDATSQPAGSPHVTLFIHSAEQCFSLTTNQPEQCFSAKFQTSERSRNVILCFSLLLLVLLACIDRAKTLQYARVYVYYFAANNAYSKTKLKQKRIIN